MLYWSQQYCIVHKKLVEDEFHFKFNKIKSNTIWVWILFVDF